MMDAALSYLELGFRVIPLHWITPGGCSCGSECKSPGKHPLTQTGVTEASADEEQIRRWWTQWPDANIGIASGKYSGIVVLDIDNKQGGLEKLEVMKDKEFPELKKALTVSTGSGGFHYYFRYPKEDAIGCRNKIDGFGIDVRGDGGYLVAPPSNHISGRRYEWLDVGDEPELTDLIDASPGLLEFMGKKSASEGKLESTIEGDVYVGEELIAKMASALRHIAPYGDNWLHCGMAIYYATGGHIKGFELWDEWAKSAPEYAHIDPRIHLKRYATFKTNRSDHITDATLWSKARADGWLWVDPDQKFVNDLPQQFNNADDVTFKAPEPGEQISSFSKVTPQIQVGPFLVPGVPEDEIPPFYDIDELNELAENDNFETFWQDHVLFRGAVFLMAGPPKVGKSTLFLQMAKAAAIGGEFFGHQFERPIKVLWIQAEIAGHYVTDRVNTVAEDLSIQDRAVFKKNFRATGRLDLAIDQDKDFSKITAMVNKFQADLVCIDPLINFSSVNENDNTEVRGLMRRIVALTKVLRDESAVAFLHHTSKPNNSKFGSKEPFDMIRGAGAIRGAYDTGIVLTDEPKNKMIRVTYETRNGKEPDEHGLFRAENGLFSRCDLPDQKNKEGQYAGLKVDEKTPRNNTDLRVQKLLSLIVKFRNFTRGDILKELAIYGIKESGAARYVNALKAHADQGKDPLISYNNETNGRKKTLTFTSLCDPNIE
ncbi:MAG: AAA family ATPase [Planctomycetaceae bacterium]|nr:AAA family ATPase [Planctomycetaceae bacterium]